MYMGAEWYCIGPTSTRARKGLPSLAGNFAHQGDPDFLLLSWYDIRFSLLAMSALAVGCFGCFACFVLIASPAPGLAFAFLLVCVRKTVSSVCNFSIVCSLACLFACAGSWLLAWL